MEYAAAWMERMLLPVALSNPIWHGRWAATGHKEVPMQWRQLESTVAGNLDLGKTYQQMKQRGRSLLLSKGKIKDSKLIHKGIFFCSGKPSACPVSFCYSQ